MTMAEVSSVTGQRGDYTVTLKLTPRYVNANCTACGACAAAVEAEIPNPYEYGLGKTRRSTCRLRGYPMHYVLDPSIIGAADDGESQGGLQIMARHRPSICRPNGSS